MKRILFVGLIALLVLLAVPAAMAAAGSTADVTLSGPVTASYSIEATNTNPTPAVPWFAVGDNEWDWGTLHIVTTNTAWAVTTTTSGNPGHLSQMYAGTGSPMLTKPLQQVDTTYPTVGWGYVNVESYGDSGSLAGGAVDKYNTLYYQQMVLDTDAAGSYKLIITYTIAAV